jgi:hypothetical protein
MSRPAVVPSSSCPMEPGINCPKGEPDHAIPSTDEVKDGWSVFGIISPNLVTWRLVKQKNELKFYALVCLYWVFKAQADLTFILP